jgi:hypothetical protein
MGSIPVASGPTNTVAPVLDYDPLDDFLFSTTGTWTGSPTSYSYDFQRDTFRNGVFTSQQSGASSTYTTPAANHNWRVIVTATNGSGNGTANSNTYTGL